ncbi:MAG: chloride channel protein, partial [Selenomonas sp.]
MPENIERALLYVKKPAHFRLRLFTDGLLIGALVGAVIALYHWLLESADHLRPVLYDFLRDASPLWTAGYFLALLALSVVVRYLMQLDSMVGGGGIPDLKGILRGDSHLRWARVLFGKFASVVLGIGAGLSLGRGGPSVEIGACVGAGVSRTAGRSRAEERFLLTAGAGAGFAAIFNAPLASLVFSFEELAKN